MQPGTLTHPIRCVLVLIIAACAACFCRGYSAQTRQIVFVIGENEYHTWETLPDFAKNELEPRGLKCSFVNASTREGDTVFTNFAIIRDADLLFISVRRRTPPKEILSLIHSHSS